MLNPAELGHEGGFSLIELIVILIIVGVLAAVAIPRLVGQSEYQSLGFYDSAQATVRYGQKLAVAQRRNVHVIVAANSLRLCYDAGCGSAVIDPVSNAPYLLSAPGGVSLSGPNLSFDGLGRPTPGGTFVVTDSDGARSFVVEPETGYVHP